VKRLIVQFAVKKWIWLAVIVAAVTLADQVTKRWAASALARPITGVFPPPCDSEGPMAERELMQSHHRVTVIEGYFDLTYTENCGGAFSILQKKKQSLRRPFFIAAYLLAGALLLYFFHKVRPDEKLLLAAFPAVLGGAVGNLIDRAGQGYVVDFIYWHVRDAARWPVFNIADVGITVGLCLILVDAIFLAPAREKKAKAQEAKS
jgi:signal peptidase II